MIVFLTTLLILLCLAVVLLILIQRTSGGMGSALGGGAADQYLGAGSAAQLSKLTVWGIFFFFVFSFGLYALYQKKHGAEDELLRSVPSSASIVSDDASSPLPAEIEDFNEAANASAPSSASVDPAPIALPVPAPSEESNSSL